MSKRSTKKNNAMKEKKENSLFFTDSAGVVKDDFVDAVSNDPRVQLTQLDFEKQAALQKAGKEEEVYGFWGKVYKFIEWYHSKSTGQRVKKKTYLMLLVLTGWIGGHRWYQGRKILALIETCLFWTGLPLILCVTDFMEVYPIQADEEGYIVF